MTTISSSFPNQTDIEPDPPVSTAIQKTMRGNRGKNTLPEIALRSLVHALGYRYRIHGRELPGTPDLVFTARRKVIWLHGCYWHAHPGCRFATVPKTRAAFWTEKFARNRERDAEHEVRLREMGWASLTVWECEMKDPTAVQKRVCEFLGTTCHQ
jgi:DNA mismatch endonuclease (patch repair protein)